MELNQSNLRDYLQRLSEKGVNFNDTPSVLVGIGDSAVNTQTLSNGGIPAAVAQVIDPNIIKQLFAPTVATQIYSEVRKGTFAHDIVSFPRTEETYEVVSYDDFAKTGSVSVNSNFENRKNYRFQTQNVWGDLEQERYGLAMIPYISMKQTSSINAIRRFFNLSYMYGISGSQNYGIMNDPALLPAITVTTTAGGKLKWEDKDAIDIYNDFVKMFTQLSSQTNGLVAETDNLKLCVSPTDNAALTKVNSTYGTMTAWQRIKETFTGVQKIIVPEFGTVVGGLIQLIADSIQGQVTGQCVPSELMRTYPIFVDGSMTSQKVAAGTFGAVIYQPMGVVQMTGSK